MDILIFITVGTSNYSFNRLFKIIDELIEEKVLDGTKVLAQIGFSEYNAKNFKTIKFLEAQEHHKYLEKSEFIISHSGTGSVISSLKMGKKVIVFPRLEKYHEMCDDHQLELTNFLTENDFILSAMDKEQLKKCIQSINEFKPKKFKSNSDNFNKLIIDIIQGDGLIESIDVR